jgi:hypothetical protein
VIESVKIVYGCLNGSAKRFVTVSVSDGQCVGVEEQRLKVC